MKNAITILLLALSVHINAQHSVPIEKREKYLYNNSQNNIYFKDINGAFDKFLGKWIYKKDNDLVEIEILKVEKDFYDEGNYYLDELCAKIKYTRNDTVIFNTYNKAGYIISGGFFMKSNKTDEVTLIFEELSEYWNEGVCVLTLQSLKRKPNEMYWSIKKGNFEF